MEKAAMDLILGATQSAGSGGGGGSDVPTPASGDTGKVLTVGSGQTLEWDDVPKELPTPASGDAGKVLTVGSGQTMEWDDVPKELPTPAAGDTGKVLTVGSGQTMGWDNVPKELPSIASADKGKFLKVDNLGAPAWAAVPTELPSHTASDKDKMLSVNSSNNVVWKAVPTELPAHTASDKDKVLSVANDGSLVWGAGGGGGSDLPEYDEGNAGDFLQVADDGSLWWTDRIPGPTPPRYDDMDIVFTDQNGSSLANAIPLTGALTTENPGDYKPRYIGVLLAGTNDWANDLVLQQGQTYKLQVRYSPIIPKAIIIRDADSGWTLMRIYPRPNQGNQTYIDVDPAGWSSYAVDITAQFILTDASVTIEAGKTIEVLLMV